MKSSASLINKQLEHGRVIARAFEIQKVVHQKNMAKAERRKETILENQAKLALSGGIINKGVKG